MTDFFIFRHGDTEESGESALYFFIKRLGRKHDSHNLEILPKGIPALAAIGEYLKKIRTDADFSSPYPRCVKSAKIVSDVSGKKYKTDDRIKELENKGESFSSFHDRVYSFLKEIEKKNYSAVSICTHGAVMAAIKHFVINGNFYFFQVVDYPRPGILLVIKNGRVSQINFNNDGVNKLHTA